jgi:Polyketide cyclase / dehydrase and lipid transport
MAPFVSIIEIDAPPSDVFAYAVDPMRFAEWQKDVVSVHMDKGDRLPWGRGSRRLATSAVSTGP